ncbi:endonuclease [Marinicella sp. S1101]|uniref:endonuclease n=1 Tax=Marinicella marina TaxID=2996016 RepID=UPI002260A444|nr:endonuclease [Marinicella marina]MCX7552566.1 endonuclease [Marinicella marina]MDJ1139442.1 endonuclease [Marinicella marina]
MFKHHVSVGALLCACLFFNHNQVAAQADPNYYNSVDESSPSALRNSLHAIIDDHTRFPYTSSATDTWDVLELAGEDVDNTNQVITIYKNSANNKVGGGNNNYNREHSWPKSYGFPNDGSSNYPYTDMHHLFIADSSYNSSRSNKPYDICSSGCSERPTEVNNNRGGSGQSNFTKTGIWDVWTGRQGDIARAMFYMDVRYEGGTHGVTGSSEPDLRLTDNLSLINASSTGNNESVAYMGLLSVLLVWHQNDPVDIYEHQHNEAVAAAQGNRNPFIDNPGWVRCVFELVCEGGGIDNTPPDAVTNLTASVNNNSVYVDWYNNDETDLAGYTVYRSVNNSNNFNPLNANLRTFSNYTDTAISPGNTYYYYVTADDNAGNESANSAIASVTLPGGGDNTLSNGVSKTGLTGSTSNQKFYTFEVPAGANSLNFAISGGSGDADLYVKFGSQPTTSSYDCRPWLNGNNETCTISNIQAGTYHVMVRAYASYSGVNLVANYSSTQQTVFSNGSNVNIPDNNPAGATSSINATLSGQAGNMAISYNIVHTYRGDLRVQLIAPNGTITTLRNPSGGSTNNLNETINTNQGSISANGTWRLKVVDIYNQDTGYINSWQIEFL